MERHLRQKEQHERNTEAWEQQDVLTQWEKQGRRRPGRRARRTRPLPGGGPSAPAVTVCHVDVWPSVGPSVGFEEKLEIWTFM